MDHSTRSTAGGGVNRLFATRTDALNAQYAIAGGAAEPHTRARGSPQDWCCQCDTLFLLLHSSATPVSPAPPPVMTIIPTSIPEMTCGCPRTDIRVEKSPCGTQPFSRRGRAPPSRARGARAHSPRHTHCVECTRTHHHTRGRAATLRAASVIWPR